MDENKKLYTIGGRAFVQEALVLGQELWLAEHVFDGFQMQALTLEDVWKIVKTKGALLFAVILTPEEQTRAEKVTAGWEAVRELEAWFLANMEPSEMLSSKVIQDFFVLNQQGNLWMLVEHQFVKEARTMTG